MGEIKDVTPWLSEGRGLPAFGVMLQIQGIKGEAVVYYCEPLITRKVGIIGFPIR